MKKTLRHTLLASLALVAGTAAAQVQTMTVHLSNGTQQTFPVTTVDSVTFAESEDASAFQLTMPEVSEVYGLYSIVPTDKTITYNAMWLPKEDYDLYESDEQVVQDDLAFYQEYADYYGMTLSQLLSYFLIEGDLSDYITGILPDHEYVMWVYGLDTNGNQTTPLQKVTFRTAPVSDTTDKTVGVSLATSNGSTVATFTPEDETLPYAAGYLMTANLSGDLTPEEVMQESISGSLYDYLASGEGVASFLDSQAYKGTDSATYSGVDGSTETYVLAAFLNSNGAICSPVTKVKVGENAQSQSAAKVAAPAGKKLTVTKGRRSLNHSALKALKR